MCLTYYSIRVQISTYADDGVVVSSDPAWLQGAFSALVAIFNRVGLKTNVGNIVSMACHHCRAGAGNRTEAGYSRRLTGVGKTYTKRQRERVACRECGTLIAAGSMSSHMMTRHGKAATRRHLWDPQTNGGPRLYKIIFPTKDGRRRCPVEGCPGVSASTSCTGTSTTPWLYWRRANSPYHGAPGATFRSPGRRLTGATWRPVSAGQGRSGNDGD